MASINIKALLKNVVAYKASDLHLVSRSEPQIRIDGKLVPLDMDKLDGNIPFDGVFCANDEMAIGLIKGLMKLGKKIPDDISVIGFDDVDVAQYICGGLSTIGINYESWGISVAKDMLAILAGQEVPQERIVPVKLVPRNT